nr:tryptophan 7-halogenase [Alteromonas sp. 5E99-2]
MYGSITSPEAYKFNINVNCTEPDLLLKTGTSFSFGTGFVEWGQQKHQWMQCFHLPFHAEAGVYFHHFMTRHNANLSDYLISAQAAKLGRFAHPPSDNPNSALSRAEYGYHFDPLEWSELFYGYATRQDVNIIESAVTSVQVVDGNIASILLNNETKITADLFIDCSGSKSYLLSELNGKRYVQRQVQATSTRQAVAQTGPSYRQVRGRADGWESITPLQNCNLHFSQKALNGDVHKGYRPYSLGHNEKAWIGNCVGIGHSAYMLEPVTHGPYTLLMKDIERLLELVPLGRVLEVESKEYNRRYLNDIEHGLLFHKALYHDQYDVGYSVCEKLARKLTQFNHRGIVASFDLEPFNAQDWTILHAGVARTPNNYDQLADQVSEKDMAAKLTTMKKGIVHLAKQMPPHHLYITKLKQHLRGLQ